LRLFRFLFRARALTFLRLLLRGALAAASDCGFCGNASPSATSSSSPLSPRSSAAVAAVSLAAFDVPLVDFPTEESKLNT